jgi:hypothetical protein
VTPPRETPATLTFAEQLSLLGTADDVRKHSRHLMTSNHREIRLIIASNPHTPAEVIGHLAFDNDGAVREAARAHVRLPYWACLRAMDDSEESARVDLVHWWIDRIDDAVLRGNPRAIAKGFGQAVRKSPHLEVLDYLASHPCATPYALRALAAHPDPLLREVVASNPRTPAVVLSKLARDPYGGVRLHVAMNPAAPSTALKRLLGDPSSAVREAASQRTSEFAPIFATSRVTGPVGESEDTANEGSDLDEDELEVQGLTDMLPISQQREFEDARPITEVIAIRASIAFEQMKDRHVQVMPPNNEGYDLISVAKDREPQFLEVKGVGPTSTSVHLTRPQLECALQFRTHFVLFVVTNDGERAIELLRIEDPYPHPLPAELDSVDLKVEVLRTRAEVVSVIDGSGTFSAPGPLFSPLVP